MAQLAERFPVNLFVFLWLLSNGCEAAGPIASIDTLTLLAGASGHVSLRLEASAPAISPAASIGFFALGALAASFALLIAFRIPKWLALATCTSGTASGEAKEIAETEEPLLSELDREKSGGC